MSSHSGQGVAGGRGLLLGDTRLRPDARQSGDEQQCQPYGRGATHDHADETYQGAGLLWTDL